MLAETAGNPIGRKNVCFNDRHLIHAHDTKISVGSLHSTPYFEIYIPVEGSE